MTIQDLKITSEDYLSKDISGLPDRPSEAGMSATDLKARFDASTKHIVQPKFNQLIEILNSSEGADNIGITPIEGIAGYTVQQILLAIKLLLDDKKNAEQSDREIAQKFDTSEAQALVKEVTFSEGSGVFTITKYDGSVQAYDTALEKVALDVRLDGQQFVLTLADGTEQRVDLSAFLTQTEVKGSETISLSIEFGAIVARLATGSIQKMHLSDALIEYIEGKEGLAADSAAAAKVSEQNALNSANTAKASEQAAKTCQEQACSCATQAGLSRDAAKASEQAAKEAAERASNIAPMMSDGKLPVQNGGWYINSETTEEDKAEAKATLEELGLDADVDLSEYLKSDGTVAMTGILVNKNQASFAGLTKQRTLNDIVYDAVYGVGGGSVAGTASIENGSYESGSREIISRLDIGRDKITYRGKDATNSKNMILYGEHNITSGTTALTAGTDALPTGYIYLQYE